MDYTKNQQKLALRIATEIERSGCNVGECLQVLVEHTGALIGRHTPNDVEIARYCSALTGVVREAARFYHSHSDIHPQNKSK